MDLTTRKNIFKDRFDQIKDIDLIERFENFWKYNFLEIRLLHIQFKEKY